MDARRRNKKGTKKARKKNSSNFHFWGNIVIDKNLSIKGV